MATALEARRSGLPAGFVAEKRCLLFNCSLPWPIKLKTDGYNGSHLGKPNSNCLHPVLQMMKARRGIYEKAKVEYDTEAKNCEFPEPSC